MRVYEVHVFNKTTLLNAFLPYFETVFFLRMSQCVQLKDD
jgi:hypothetical protein